MASKHKRFREDLIATWPIRYSRSTQNTDQGWIPISCVLCCLHPRKCPEQKTWQTDSPTHPNHPFRESIQVPNREHETNEYANSPQTPKLKILVGEQERDYKRISTRHCPRKAAPRATSLGHLGHRRHRDSCVVLQQMWKATVSYSTCPACAAKLEKHFVRDLEN